MENSTIGKACRFFLILGLQFLRDLEVGKMAETFRCLKSMPEGAGADRMIKLQRSRFPMTRKMFILHFWLLMNITKTPLTARGMATRFS